jgi:Flp pilus assembly pilin Flp
MLTLLNQVRFLAKDERGQTVIEYALIVILVALASVAGYQALASAVSSGLNNISGQLT